MANFTTEIVLKNNVKISKPYKTRNRACKAAGNLASRTLSEVAVVDENGKTVCKHFMILIAGPNGNPIASSDEKRLA